MDNVLFKIMLCAFIKPIIYFKISIHNTIKYK